MTGVPCTWMRGGTSKAAYFLADNLPSDPHERDELLLRIMGSPDPRQIDGIGGGHSLTSKVAVVDTSNDDLADVDFLFLQVSVDEASVSSTQNCGNILAGVGPFAVERGLVVADVAETSVRIRMVNSASYATATFPTPGGTVAYQGTCSISGVPGTAAPISLDFSGTAGSTCGALLPTGRSVDIVDGVEVTCIDNGMPTVVIVADDVGITGHESPVDLEHNAVLADRVARIRARAAELMGLHDVAHSTVPKVTLVSPPVNGGSLDTRTFIPVRCHPSIGVLGALTVGTAARIPGSAAARVAAGTGSGIVRIEHPAGFFDVDIDIEVADDVRSDNDRNSVIVRRAAVIRTARKLFEGNVFPTHDAHETKDLP